MKVNDTSIRAKHILTILLALAGRCAGAGTDSDHHRAVELLGQN